MKLEGEEGEREERGRETETERETREKDRVITCLNFDILSTA